MRYYRNNHLLFTLCILLFFISCNGHKETTIKEKEIVADPRTIDEYIQSNLEDILHVASENNGKINDTFRIYFYGVLNNFYNSKNYKPSWSRMAKWDPLSDSLLGYIKNASQDGLFPGDYHFTELNELKEILNRDSVKRMDAVLWAKVDLLHTDAFMHILQDLKQGRLQPDSLAWKNDTAMQRIFFLERMNELIVNREFSKLIDSVQPVHTGYLNLKKSIKNFIDSMDTKTYTYIHYPYKKNDEKDSLMFIQTLQERLVESGIVNKVSPVPDSTALSALIKQYQKGNNITADGKITAALINKLNLSDAEKYKRIAITLDRYKQLPAAMPEKYIWVNLPAYSLTVWDADTLVFQSKVICGKPTTPTPVLTSAISDLVIFPTWTVPESIITKEMLPGLKKNTGYLARKGLSLLNNKGEEVDPATVNWAKYSKGIPYKIQQGSGDENALGVIKFNFSNPFAVYLHDTNQRYLFKNSARALSHGCVRVQDWKNLAFYIIRNDSIHKIPPDTLRYTTDSITSWIAQKERHRINVAYKFPLFIRYFGCEVVNGSIKFYDDIYGLDKLMRDKYFAVKN